MESVRLTLGLAACLTALATGCASSRGKVGEVQDVGAGTYSIGVSSGGIGGISQSDDAVKAGVDKAGAYCHSKGQKLQVTGVASSKITFRCVSDGEMPQKKQAE
jgi:hypothetical protein